MTNETPCPCHSCTRAATCNWTCDAFSEWAEDKSFARVAEEFVDAGQRAARKHPKRRRRTA